MSPANSDPSAPGPVITEEQPDSSDSLLERWLAQSVTSQRQRRAAVGPWEDAAREQLGDELADRWFR